MPVFVGLDCGGSSSRVLAVDEAGEVLFRGQAGAANLLSTPGEVLALSLRAATQGCPEATFVCGCFAGLVGAQQKREAENLLRNIFAKSRAVRAEPDYAAALTACGPETTACVVAGTGSIVCSRTASGWIKTGGRGPLLGDPGSASRIGREALNRFLDDERKAPHSLTAGVKEVFRSVESAEVIAQVYGSRSPAALLGKLAKSIGQAAQSGEDYALALVNSEMGALARLLKRHLERTRADGQVVGLAGGLWKASPIFRETFASALEDLELKNYELFVLKRAPVEGAVALAKEMSLGN